MVWIVLDHRFGKWFSKRFRYHADSASTCQTWLRSMKADRLLVFGHLFTIIAMLSNDFPPNLLVHWVPPHTVESPLWNARHKLVGIAPQWDHPNFVIFYYQTSIWVFIRTWLIFLLWIANFVYRRFRTSFSWTLRCYIATCSTVSMKTFHKVHQSEEIFQNEELLDSKL